MVGKLKTFAATLLISVAFSCLYFGGVMAIKNAATYYSIAPIKLHAKTEAPVKAANEIVSSPVGAITQAKLMAPSPN